MSLSLLAVPAFSDQVIAPIRNARGDQGRTSSGKRPRIPSTRSWAAKSAAAVSAGEGAGTSGIPEAGTSGSRTRSGSVISTSVPSPGHSKVSAESQTAIRGSEDLDFRKVATVVGGIAGEQCQAPNGSMRANIEIGQRRGPQAPAAAV